VFAQHPMARWTRAVQSDCCSFWLFSFDVADSLRIFPPAVHSANATLQTLRVCVCEKLKDPQDMPQTLAFSKITGP
jgi:hypothetical protein